MLTKKRCKGTAFFAFMQIFSEKKHLRSFCLSKTNFLYIHSIYIQFTTETIT